MDPVTLTQNPFTALTFIAAPALLTNATSTLAQSTATRMLATRESMSQLVATFKINGLEETEDSAFDEHVDRIKSQAKHLLDALHSIYLALGAFAAATLVTLIGAALIPFQGALWFDSLAFLGLAMGAMGVGCLIFGSVRLFQTTRLSYTGISDDATRILRDAERLRASRKRN
jgi:hypothetical protein